MSVDNTSVINLTDHDEDADLPCSITLKIFTITVLLFAICGVVLNAFLLFICVEFFGFSKCYLGSHRRSMRRHGSIITLPRPQYALNCYVFNGALAAILASAIQTVRGMGNTFFDQDIFYMIRVNGTEEISPSLLDLSAALVFMSTLFGPFAVAHLNFLFLLNVDKLFYILKPLHYDQIMNRKGRAVLACLVMWSFSFTWIPMMMAFRDRKQDMLRIETVLICVLHLVPTAFGLISACVVAVTANRMKIRGRKNRRPFEHNDIDLVMRPHATHISSTWRSFLGIAWTTLFSLPHPSVRTVLYCYAKDSQEFVSMMENCSVATMAQIVVNFSVAYLVGIPLIIICTHRAYRHRARELIRWLLKLKSEETETDLRGFDGIGVPVMCEAGKQLK